MRDRARPQVNPPGDRRGWCRNRLISGCLGLLALTALGTPAGAEEVVEAERLQEMLRRGACLLCHQPVGERIGPSFRDIARRYRDGGDKIRDSLVWRIRNGAVGNYSPVPMGPCDGTRLTDEELRRVVDHILNGGHAVGRAASAGP